MKLTLHQMVRQFHEVGGLPIRHRPEVPSDERVRLRLDMAAEELFELIEAALAIGQDDDDHTDFVHGPRYQSAKVAIKSAIQNLPVSVNLPAFTDALTDMDYINEGTRLEFGVYGQEVLEEVHRANMNKFARCGFCSVGRPLTTLNASDSCVECGGKGYLVVRREDGKILKPEGWKPPNIEHVLLEQGWKPPLKGAPPSVSEIGSEIIRGSEGRERS